jgi:hypothetical protein
MNQLLFCDFVGDNDESGQGQIRVSWWQRKGSGQAKGIGLNKRRNKKFCLIASKRAKQKRT